MEYSCLKTLASKHKTSLVKIRAKYKDGFGSWAIPYETKQQRKGGTSQITPSVNHLVPLQTLKAVQQ